MLLFPALSSSFSNIAPTSGVEHQTNAIYSGLRTFKGLLRSDIPELENLIFVEKKVM